MLGTENTIDIESVVEEINKAIRSKHNRIKLLTALKSYAGHNDNFTCVDEAIKKAQKPYNKIK